MNTIDKNIDDNTKDEKFPGYPHHTSKEDIYNRGKELSDIDPEDLTHQKGKNWPADEPNELDFSEDLIGDDLDVPGAELDDAQEDIGSEDEENNYYSLGGDNHDD
jgi:hypothetical protein